jgi:hypothetical protein
MASAAGSVMGGSVRGGGSASVAAGGGRGDASVAATHFTAGGAGAGAGGLFSRDQAIKGTASVGLASGTAGAPGETGGRTKAIAAVQFGTLSSSEMVRMSSIQVCSRELYRMPTRTPAPYGCLDPRLGISNKADSCSTCGAGLQDCAGHFGFVKLELPVFHIGFFKAVAEILTNVCKTCSRVLLGPADRKGYLRLMRNPQTDGERYCCWGGGGARGGGRSGAHWAGAGKRGCRCCDRALVPR